MSSGGCAITFAANLAYTQNPQGTTPETIRSNPNNFTMDGLIFSSALSGSNVSIGNKISGSLTLATFNGLKNSSTEYYVGINVNYSGTAGNSSDRWVGATDLVTRGNNQYFKISPTSSNDWVMGTNTGVGANNRGGRGWQTDTNAQGEVTAIYVPIDQVKEYRIFTRQADE
jgi:hypothetical protein